CPGIFKPALPARMSERRPDGRRSLSLTCRPMPLTPSQEKKRERIESVIGLMAPALNVVLMAGDRISRIVQPEDYDYYPVRPIGEWQPRPSDMSPHPGD